MRNPLAHRREQRVLDALEALGSLDGYEIAELTGMQGRRLRKALLDLAVAGRVEATRSSGISSRFVWSIAAKEET